MLAFALPVSLPPVGLATIGLANRPTHFGEAGRGAGRVLAPGPQRQIEGPWRPSKTAKIGTALFDGDAFCEIARLIHIVPVRQRDMIGEQLERGGVEDRCDEGVRVGKRDGPDAPVSCLRDACRV